MRFKEMLQQGIYIRYVRSLAVLSPRTPAPCCFAADVVVLLVLGCSALDSSYVSALSWYFIISIGLRGFLSLFTSSTGALPLCHAEYHCTERDCAVQCLHASCACSGLQWLHAAPVLNSWCVCAHRVLLAAFEDEARMMQMQMTMGMGGMDGNPQAFDAAKAYEAEADFLRLAKFTSYMRNVEADMVAKYVRQRRN